MAGMRSGGRVIVADAQPVTTCLVFKTHSIPPLLPPNSLPQIHAPITPWALPLPVPFPVNFSCERKAKGRRGSVPLLRHPCFHLLESEQCAARPDLPHLALALSLVIPCYQLTFLSFPSLSSPSSPWRERPSHSRPLFTRYSHCNSSFSSHSFPALSGSSISSPYIIGGVYSWYTGCLHHRPAEHTNLVPA